MNMTSTVRSGDFYLFFLCSRTQSHSTAKQLWSETNKTNKTPLWLLMSRWSRLIRYKSSGLRYMNRLGELSGRLFFFWLSHLLTMVPSFSPPYIIFSREVLKYISFLMHLSQVVLQGDQLLLKI